MNTLLTYAGLTRLYTVVPLALLAYGIGAATGPSQLRAAAAAIAVACALAGGYAYNDLRDQSTDRVNRPARPLVSGRVTSRQARWFVTLAFIAAAIVAMTTASALTVAFILVLIACLCLYSDAVKHVAGLKNLFVGAWCGLLPWGASLGHVAAATILPAIAMVGLFITQKELVADVYDRDGDAAAGVLTIPVLLGSWPALAIVLGLNLALWAVVRNAGAVPVLMHLSTAGQLVAIVNSLALCAVALRVTKTSVRAYLELQKIWLIGGCIAFFAMVMVR